MWIIQSNYKDIEKFYPLLRQELKGLVDGEKNLIANLANISSWIYHSMPELNWCGFYLWSEKDQEMILGPFQGKPACLRIKSGRGVCGTSYQEKRTLNVQDVHEFPGHIACDSASRSELVIPLMKNGVIYGVLDLDSPNLARFSLTDEKKLTEIMNELCELIY